MDGVKVEVGKSRELFKYFFVAKPVTVDIYDRQEIEMAAISTSRSVRGERV